MEQAAYEVFLRERRQELLDRIASAAQRAGRSAHDVELLAVSKTVGPQEVAQAFAAGYALFGENRPQELRRKVRAAQEDPRLAGIRFHMIGNLQTNKINQVIQNAELVHSVSSLHLAQALSDRCEKRGMRMPCLLEVNVSGEASKSGFSVDQVRAVAEVLAGLSGIELCGLMTMAPAGDPDAAHRTFSGLRELSGELQARTGANLHTLSCGMSGDFEIAVEEGSTLVRLGRIVFDPAYRDVRTIR